MKRGQLVEMLDSRGIALPGLREILAAVDATGITLAELKLDFARYAVAVRHSLTRLRQGLRLGEPHRLQSTVKAGPREHMFLHAAAKSPR